MNLDLDGQYVIGDGWDIRIEDDPCDDTRRVKTFTSLDAARQERDRLNDQFNGLLFAVGAALVPARPWKIYQLEEIEDD